MNKHYDKWESLAHDLMDLVDMFACDKVDIQYYKRIRKAYERACSKDSGVGNINGNNNNFSNNKGYIGGYCNCEKC